ncbi:MAG: glycosyltransferase family 2 protein, partial [Chlorobiaceae bacterium]|nr:glycosyltransferase family 2 protein [Chlorobiaceae bacterium]
ENNSDCSFVMVHRDIVDSEDNVHSEAPFYNKTCIIPGFAQASVYMVAAINPSISQIMYKRETIKDFAIGGGALNVRWFGARLQDFELCCKYSIIYIHEPLLINRVHAGSDGSSIDKSLIQCVGQYLLVHQFRDLANAYGNEMAALRLEEAKTKVAFLCLRYSVRFLLAGNESVAKQYYYLSRALSESVAEDEVYKQISRYYDCDNATKRELLVSFSEIPNLHVRGNSYDPPVGSVEIDV